MSTNVGDSRGVAAAGPSRIPFHAPSSPGGSPIRGLFPGFLSPQRDTDDGLDEPTYGLSHSPSSSAQPSPTLPSLRDEPAPLQVRSHRRDESPTTPSFGSDASTLGKLSAGTIRLPVSASSHSSDRSTMPKKRPSPLALKHSAKAIGVDEELASQRDHEGLRTGRSMVSDGGVSTLSNDLQDLNVLRSTIRQNLKDRPLDSPLSIASDSESSGLRTPYREPTSAGLSLPDHATIPLPEVLALLRSTSQLLIVDTRPLGPFLDAHLPRSANISIPTLIFKRFRKAAGAKPTWESLAGFISTPAGMAIWNSIDREREVEVVVIGTSPIDEMARVLREVMDGLIRIGRVRVLQGGWGVVEDSTEAQEELMEGEQSIKSPPPFHHHHHHHQAVPPAPKTSSTAESNASPAPPPIPPSEPSRLAPRTSLPSLKSASIASKRSVPSLSVNTGHPHRTPKLSLNLDKPVRSATMSGFSSIPQAKSPGLKINTGAANRLAHGEMPHVSVTVTAPRSPAHGSLQTLCHAQSKLPPSPSTFGEITTSFGSAGPSRPPRTSGLAPRHRINGYDDEDDTVPRTAVPGSARTSVAPFIVSTILPGFLYLGPEITTEEEVDSLLKMGVKRVLNVALECNDDEGLRLKERFEKYFKVPMRDIVEETGMAKGMRDSCDFLDDARLHSAPTYVHCKAGKSRSVTVVLAYLIHANAWTLKTSYAYVAERRKGISPNIGFVAELMQFEESELGLKQSGGVHGEAADSSSTGGAGEAGDRKEKKPAARHMRESLPPAWAAASLDSRPVKAVPLSGDESHGGPATPVPGDGSIRAEGEKEVRKNGQWVHQRRAPVDRTTLQPGRRVSKAGLESLRPLASASSSTPVPSPGVEDLDRRETVTPGGDGRLGWI